MSSPLIQAIETQEELDNVLSSCGEKLLVVDFGANWCKKCKKIHPEVEKLAQKFSNHITFVSVMIDEAEDLAIDYNVSSVPHLMFFKNGKKINDYVGSSMADIRGLVSKNLPETALNRPRGLHWVLKIGNLKRSMEFYEKVLGLKVLRHEEFSEGCAATCNGPYAGAWSKTMIGYGPEDSNFALELTYNYGIDNYEFGNDLQYIALTPNVPNVRDEAKNQGYNITELENGAFMIHGPDNYNYRIIPENIGQTGTFHAIGLRTTNIQNSNDYWCGLLGLKQFDVLPGLETQFPTMCIGFAPEDTKLQLIEVNDGNPIDHALSSGRIAFACPSVTPIFEKVSKNGDVVQTPPLTLETPGKADVVVTILQDRDGYEICFVEDEAFYELATPKYDVIDWDERASRGGDGAPLPKVALIHSEAFKKINDEDELNQVLKSAGDKLVVVDFGAGWCKNCKKLMPALEKLARQYQEHSSFFAVDISDAEDLAISQGVTALPRVKFFKNGQQVDDYQGSEEFEIKSKLKQLLPQVKITKLNSSGTNAENRSLHWVLKIGNLKKTIDIFQQVFGLRVLRHEEFDSGCEATCNGPYGGQWSKTMVGYGREDQNFVLELTYNYGIDGYEFGNDLQYIAVSCPEAIPRAKALGYHITEMSQHRGYNGTFVQMPDNYKFKIIPALEGREERFQVVALRVSSLKNAEDYWINLLGMQRFETVPGTETNLPSITVGWHHDQVKLQFIQIEENQSVDHALSAGRIAFACPSVVPIYEKVVASGDTVQNPPISLPTPGKADVVVTILRDRDQYEICFVEDEAFYELATPKYDVIDWKDRFSRGADGAPIPKHVK